MFRPYMWAGYLQVVIRLDQLYYNAWSFLGNGGGLPWSRFLGGIVIGSMSSPFYQYVITCWLLLVLYMLIWVRSLVWLAVSCLMGRIIHFRLVLLCI